MTRNDDSPSYVLVTPAHNEAAFIERTVASVTSQSVLPLKWVVVNDGSTDGTGEILRRCTQGHDWIELIHLPVRVERSFAGKAGAFNAGYERIRHLPYRLIGSLDADISFDPQYFAFLIDRFALDPSLGVAGTPFQEGRARYDYRFASSEHVSGACQLFRRECFEAIGGYQPIRGGGIDWVAVTSARMLGWKTQTFTEKSCTHGRPIGTAESSVLRARFRQGFKDYYLGGHPIWQIFRSMHQMRREPYLVGGLLVLLGYLYGAASRAERPVSRQLMQFHRREQLARLRQFLKPGTGKAA